MDDRQLDAIRAVLFERLLAGEDPAELKLQLTARLDPGEAEQLMAWARERLEASRDDPTFTDVVDKVRKRRGVDGRFWRGAIVSREHAHRVANLTAYGFGGLGALMALPALALGALPTFLAALLFVAPAAALWKSKSIIAAGVLLALSAFCVLGFLAGAVARVWSVDGFGLSAIPVAGFWLLMSVAALRAFRAARFLKSPAGRAPDFTAFD